MAYENLSDSSSAFFASKPEERSFEENWNMFKTSLTAGMCQFIPQKLSRSKFKLPWIDISLKREMQMKIVCIKRLLTPKTTNIGKHLSINATLFQNLLRKLIITILMMLLAIA